ncbi:MAG: flavodoxin reductase [Bacteroidota bacterium]|nr:flavodoxin reductase [Bacteroidota bacterium]
MSQYIVKIRSIQHITPDVLQIVTDKPAQFYFTPGQATEVMINKPEWKDKKRPFTFTCLPGRDYLEFIIKTYPSHKGVTNELLLLKKDDELIIHPAFGVIVYKGEGVFIAGGAGITPFIAILRHLQSRNDLGKNKLVFANKTKEDIILAQELKYLLGSNFINILSDEKTKEYPQGQITQEFLSKYISKSIKNIYVCGPPPMMEAVEQQLSNLGVAKDTITKEKF